MLRSKKRVDFAVCVANKGYDDLEVWKVYQVLRDAKAAEVGCIRVIDESGEDYLYPADRFVMLDFPKDVRARLPRDGIQVTGLTRRCATVKKQAGALAPESLGRGASRSQHDGWR